MKRGEVWVANLNPPRPGEPAKIRPVLVMQAEWVTEQMSDTVLIIPLSTQRWKGLEHVRTTIPARGRLRQNCVPLIEKLRALGRDKFGDGPLTTLTADEMRAAEQGLATILDIN